MEKINSRIDVYFKNNPVVFLHAHPDDEVFLSGGIIQKLSCSNNVYVIFCAASAVIGENLTIARQIEAQNALKFLGINHVVFLDYYEAKYANVGKNLFLHASPDEIANSIFAAIKSFNIAFPATIVSYDQNGGYGNKDHIVVHRAGRALVKNFDNLGNLYEVTINRSKMLQWLSVAKTRNDTASIPKLNYWSRNFGMLENDIDFCYELTDPEIEKKKLALAIHSSQIKPDLFPMNISYDDFKKVFGVEYFIRGII